MYDLRYIETYEIISTHFENIRCKTINTYEPI